MNNTNTNEQFTLSETQISWMKIREIRTNVWKFHEDFAVDYGCESWNEDEKTLLRLLQHPLTPLYVGVTCNFDFRAKSSCTGAKAIYGKININEKECYFVVTDDEGMSGYACCGIITLQYSYNINDFLNECYNIDKNNYLVLKSILKTEHEPIGEMNINEWMNGVKENKLIDSYSNDGKEYIEDKITLAVIEKYIDKPWNFNSMNKIQM